MVLHTLLGVNFASIAKENRREVKERERERERRRWRGKKKRPDLWFVSCNKFLTTTENCSKLHTPQPKLSHAAADLIRSSTFLMLLLLLLSLLLLMLFFIIAARLHLHLLLLLHQVPQLIIQLAPDLIKASSFFFFCECVCVCVCVCEFFCPKLDALLSTIMYKSISHTILTDRERHTQRQMCSEREREKEIQKGTKKKEQSSERNWQQSSIKKDWTFYSQSVVGFRSIQFRSPIFFFFPPQFSFSKSRVPGVIFVAVVAIVLGFLDCSCCCNVLFFFNFITMKKWDPDLSFLFFPVDEWSNLRK